MAFPDSSPNNPIPKNLLNPRLELQQRQGLPLVNALAGMSRIEPSSVAATLRTASGQSSPVVDLSGSRPIASPGRRNAFNPEVILESPV